MTEQAVIALFVRAAKTFIQTSLGIIALNIANVTSADAFKVLVVGAAAAGVSAVMNLFLKPVEAK